MNPSLKLTALTPQYFADTIALGNLVHGDAYLTDEILDKIYHKSIKDGINASFVILDENAKGRLVGFRLTYAPTQWPMDQWCSPDLWDLPIEQLCYFKSNTVDPDYRCQGIARKLLSASIAAATEQGAKGGICHTWMQSPGNAAYEYFVHCGGKHLKTYEKRWLQDSIEGYRCIVCGVDAYCHCDAGEMILYFKDFK